MSSIGGGSSALQYQDFVAAAQKDTGYFSLDYDEDKPKVIPDKPTFRQKVLHGLKKIWNAEPPDEYGYGRSLGYSGFDAKQNAHNKFFELLNPSKRDDRSDLMKTVGKLACGGDQNLHSRVVLAVESANLFYKELTENEDLICELFKKEGLHFDPKKTRHVTQAREAVLSFLRHLKNLETDVQLVDLLTELPQHEFGVPRVDLFLPDSPMLERVFECLPDIQKPQSKDLGHYCGFFQKVIEHIESQRRQPLAVIQIEHILVRIIPFALLEAEEVRTAFIMNRVDPAGQLPEVVGKLRNRMLQEVFDIVQQCGHGRVPPLCDLQAVLKTGVPHIIADVKAFYESQQKMPEPDPSPPEMAIEEQSLLIAEASCPVVLVELAENNPLYQQIKKEGMKRDQEQVKVFDLRDARLNSQLAMPRPVCSPFSYYNTMRDVEEQMWDEATKRVIKQTKPVKLKGRLRDDKSSLPKTFDICQVRQIYGSNTCWVLAPLAAMIARGWGDSFLRSILTSHKGEYSVHLINDTVLKVNEAEVVRKVDFETAVRQPLRYIYVRALEKAMLDHTNSRSGESNDYDLFIRMLPVETEMYPEKLLDEPAFFCAGEETEASEEVQGAREELFERVIDDLTRFAHSNYAGIVHLSDAAQGLEAAESPSNHVYALCEVRRREDEETWALFQHKLPGSGAAREDPRGYVLLYNSLASCNHQYMGLTELCRRIFSHRIHVVFFRPKALQAFDAENERLATLAARPKGEVQASVPFKAEGGGLFGGLDWRKKTSAPKGKESDAGALRPLSKQVNETLTPLEPSTEVVEAFSPGGITLGTSTKPQEDESFKEHTADDYLTTNLAVAGEGSTEHEYVVVNIVKQNTEGEVDASSPYKPVMTARSVVEGEDEETEMTLLPLQPLPVSSPEVKKT